MIGIDLNKPIFYHSASFRYFAPNECHIERICSSHVLLMVFEGVLRFTEDGTEYEVHAGEYFIQKKGGSHVGTVPSDSPKYLYVHFDGTWSTRGGRVLPSSGTFNYRALSPLMTELDRAAHYYDSYVTQAIAFFQILSALHKEQTTKLPQPRTQLITEYIEEHYLTGITLQELCEKFHFSKNYIIKLIKTAYGMTPIEYLNAIRLQKAEELLEVTSDKAESVAYSVGFQNYSHFYRLFYEKNGVSPSAFRCRKRGK